MSLKSSNKIETNTYELEVSIDAKTFNDAVMKAYNKKKSKIDVPGWRKGKAPKHFIEAIYGEGVFYDDALDMVYPEAVDEAIKEAQIITVDTPYDVDIKEIGKDGVELVMKVTVKPEITVTSYKGLEACKHTVAVSDEEVNAEIEKLRDRNATITTVEDRAAADGDTAVIDYEGFVDGVAFEGGKDENHELVLGSGYFIPGFEDQVVGHSTGEEFDVNVTFPDEYSSKELEGKAAVFKVKINEIKAKILPELDDEFAKDVSEDANTLDELKASISAQQLKEKQEHSDADFENELLLKLADNVEGEIPECMFQKKAKENTENFERRVTSQGIDFNMYLMYMGMQREQLEAEMLAQATSQVKVRLALEKIAEAESLETTDEELEAEYERMAKAYGVSADSVKSFFDAENVKLDLLCEKAIAVVKDNAVVCEHSHDDEHEHEADDDKCDCAADAE